MNEMEHGNSISNVQWRKKEKEDGIEMTLHFRHFKIHYLIKILLQCVLKMSIFLVKEETSQDSFTS